MMPTWIVAAGLVLAALALLLALYAAAVEPYRPVLRRVEVPVPEGWPRLSVLHLSDLHVRTGADRLYRAQARFLRSLPGTPDLVCVTGDICEELADAPLAAALLSLVRPRLGTFAVLGNHEHDAPQPAAVREATRSGWGRLARLAWTLLGTRRHSSGAAEGHAIAETLSAGGLRVLLNEGERLEIGGASLWVAGLDSAWAGCAHPAAATRGRREGEPCLGLVHEPEGAADLVARGAALVLAGHTHGGQVRLPLVGAPVTLRTDPRITIPAGLQRLGRGALHISAGLGHTTPLRFNCPPEATWIECVPAADAPPAFAAEQAHPRRTAPMLARRRAQG